MVSMVGKFPGVCDVGTVGTLNRSATFTLLLISEP